MRLLLWCFMVMAAVTGRASAQQTTGPSSQPTLEPQPLDLGPTAEPFRVDQCTEICDYPDIQGGRVVYENHRGPGIEVYGWNLNTHSEFMVVHDDPHQHFPVIYGDIVAYTDLRYSTQGLDGTDVFARNLITGQEFAVVVAPGQQINLAIGPRYIVWEDDRNGPTGNDDGSYRDIYGYDMMTGQAFPIATGPAVQLHPDIDGSRVVWVEGDNILGRDLATGQDFVVTTLFSIPLRPAIRSDWVVWEDWRNSNWDIFGYRFSTGQEYPIAVAPGDQNFADISEELIVWQDERHGNWDVYVHVIETGEQFAVTRNTRKQKWPAVDGNTVVWSDFRELEPRIYGFIYDGSLPPDAKYAIEANPTQLVVGAFPGGDIPLTWQDNSTEETSYVVERHTGMLGTDFEVIATLPANSESFTDTDTVINQAYWYRIYAVNDEGRSATTNESYNLALPATPYPNEQERYMQVLINEVRADPATFGFPEYPAQPPVVYQANLTYAARAHTTVSNLPGGSGGHVDWADRGPGERALASGYDHNNVSENMGGAGPTAADVYGANQGFLHSYGHRDNMLVAGTPEVGLGYYFLWADRQGGWVETFGGRDGLVAPTLPAGAVAPFEGRPGDDFTYIVNYYHSGGVAPTSAQVVVDGLAYDMSLSVGAAGNATYRYTMPLNTAGYNHTYYFYFAFPGGTARLPEIGTFNGPRVHGDGPDLDVTWLQTSTPVLGRPATASAWVTNGGTAGANNVTIRFYLGDPQDGGVPVGETQISVPAGSATSADISWLPPVAGSQYLYAVADPDNQLAEWSEENNIRRTAIMVIEASTFVYLPFISR